MKVEKDVKIRIVTAILALVLFAGCYYYIHNVMRPAAASSTEQTTSYAKATILELKEDNTTRDEESEGVLRGSQEVSLKITSGLHKGEVYEVTNYMSALYNIDCQKGTHIVVRLDKREAGNYEVTIYNYDRQTALIAAIVIFMLALCVIGGKKGAMSLISLIYTLANFLFLLVPAMYYGAPVLPTTIAIIIVTNFVCFIFIDGINKKTMAASLGTTSGVILAGIFAFVLGKVVHVSGFQTNEAEQLLLTGRDYGLTITNLFTAGILISALGAVMDVAMSIASAINELHTVNQKLSAKELFRSGMNIGRDAMGTMSNTLILAFVGSSLNLVLLIYSYNIPVTQLFATDLVAREIIQGIAGSIGIVLTVPIVALIGSLLFAHKGQQDGEK